VEFYEKSKSDEEKDSEEKDSEEKDSEEKEVSLRKKKIVENFFKKKTIMKLRQ